MLIWLNNYSPPLVIETLFWAKSFKSLIAHNSLNVNSVFISVSFGANKSVSVSLFAA